MNTENPEACAYYLAKRPEAIARLWSLEASGQGLQVLKELNDLSAGLRFAGSTAQTGAGA
jgi:hypothetical protein